MNSAGFNGGGLTGGGKSKGFGGFQCDFGRGFENCDVLGFLASGIFSVDSEVAVIIAGRSGSAKGDASLSAALMNGFSGVFARGGVATVATEWSGTSVSSDWSCVCVPSALSDMDGRPLCVRPLQSRLTRRVTSPTSVDPASLCEDSRFAFRLCRSADTILRTKVFS
jgi:hypothetical protein